MVKSITPNLAEPTRMHAQPTDHGSALAARAFGRIVGKFVHEVFRLHFQSDFAADVRFHVEFFAFTKARQSVIDVKWDDRALFVQLSGMPRQKR